MSDAPTMAHVGVHPSAHVDPRAELGEVIVGPGASIGPDVVIGDGTVVGSGAVLEGPMWIGRRNRIGPLAHLGGDPQDMKFRGGQTRLIIGDRNDFRSFCTVNRGTEDGGGVTRIGDGCLLMHYTHVAHDCVLEDGVVMANSANLGGHIHIERNAVIAALVGVHQFVRIGRLAMVAAGSMATNDVPPFCLVQGDRARLIGLNTVALRRAGVPAASREALKRAVRTVLRRGGVIAERAAALREANDDEYVAELLDFLDRSTRGICR